MHLTSIAIPTLLPTFYDSLRAVVLPFASPFGAWIFSCIAVKLAIFCCVILLPLSQLSRLRCAAFPGKNNIFPVPYRHTGYCASNISFGRIDPTRFAMSLYFG